MLHHAVIYPTAGKTPQVPYHSLSSDKDFCFNPLLTPEVQLEVRWFGAEHAASVEQVEVKLLRAEPAPGLVAGLGAAGRQQQCAYSQPHGISGLELLGHRQQASGCDPPALFPRGLIAICRQPGGIEEVLQIAAVYLFTGTTTGTVFLLLCQAVNCRHGDGCTHVGRS